MSEMGGNRRAIHKGGKAGGIERSCCEARVFHQLNKGMEAWWVMDEVGKTYRNIDLMAYLYPAALRQLVAA